MKYASAIALATVLATAANATPVKRVSSITCQDTPIDQLWSARLQDVKAVEHAKAHGEDVSSNDNVHVNTVATEGLIFADDNKVLNELWRDDPNKAVHFYVQQCNSVTLNASPSTMNGDLPVRLLYKDDPSLCASAINIDQGETSSTPLQLLPCQQDDDSGLKAQFWAQYKDSTSLAFLGNVQDGSSNYWASETGGGDSFRTPNVMQNPCPDNDQGCKDGAIDWLLLWD